MACPFFMPVERIHQDDWIVSPRLPLNDAFSGTCRAGVEPFEPPERSQRELCNCGYARGRCESFPADSEADAIRFSVIDENDGIVRLVYVAEREYSPILHEVLEYSIAESSVMGDVTEVVAAQARAFLASYLRRAIAQAV